MEQVNLLKSKKYLFIDSLPQTVNGALVFRLGFEEGINWLKEPASVDSVIVLSLKNLNDSKSKPYRVEMVPGQKPLFSGKALVRDSSQKRTYLIENRLLEFNSSTDAWFVFTNYRLKVIE